MTAQHTEYCTLPYTTLMDGINHSQDSKWENFIKKPQVLASFEPALSTEEEILSSLLLVPAQTCVVKHTGDLVKTRLVLKKNQTTVGFNPHQLPNLFWYAATQTPTLIETARRKLLPSTAVLAESVNET